MAKIRTEGKGCCADRVHKCNSCGMEYTVPGTRGPIVYCPECDCPDVEPNPEAVYEHLEFFYLLNRSCEVFEVDDYRNFKHTMGNYSASSHRRIYNSYNMIGKHKILTYRDEYNNLYGVLASEKNSPETYNFLKSMIETLDKEDWKQVSVLTRIVDELVRGAMGKTIWQFRNKDAVYPFTYYDNEYMEDLENGTGLDRTIVKLRKF